MLSVFYLAGGLLLLVFGADRFITGAAGTAKALGIPSLIIGMTIVGIATSAPELLVGSVAAWNGKTNIAIGNAVGSNIANIGMVLGGTLLICPITVVSRTLRMEFFLMCLAILLPLLLMLNNHLSRIDGAILVLSLIGIIWWIIKLARQSSNADALANEFAQELAAIPSVSTSLLLFIAGLLLLLAGANLVVRGAVAIAQAYGVSDLVIGLTIVAVGTSLPELAASFMSILKQEADIAIGNIIGSNMFNMLIVLGVPALIHPDSFSSAVLWRDFPVMIGLTILMGIMVFVLNKGRLGRIEGLLLLTFFVAYQYWLFYTI
jgi:cation:H+ antiporter